MGRLASLVNMPKKRQAFKAKYNILARAEIEHHHLREWHTKRLECVVVIPMITFI